MVNDDRTQPEAELAPTASAPTPETKDEAAPPISEGGAASHNTLGPILALLGLCLFAVALRLLYTWKYMPAPESDFQWYREAGLAAAKHGLVSLFRADPPVPLWILSLWPPGYHLFLGLLYTINTSVWTTPIAQALLSGCSVYLIFLTAKRWQANPWAAAVIMALYPQYIAYTAIHGSEVLSVFLLSLAILASVGPLRNGGAAGYGVAFGLTILTRAHPFFAVPGIIASLWQRRVALIIMLVCMFAVITPWSVNRSLIFKGKVFMTTFFGHLFYMGNHSTNPTGGYYEVPRPVEIPVDATVPAEDTYFLAAGIREVLLHPTHYLLVSAKRMVMWIGLKPDEWVQKYSPKWFSGLAMIAQIALFFSALAAMIGGWRERRARLVVWPAVSLLVLTALTYHMPRYTLIILPYFALIASRLRLDWLKLEPEVASAPPQA